MALDLLLLHPPATKPGEPPLGSAILSAFLRHAGVTLATLDANLGACLYLLAPQRAAAAAGPQPGTSVRRALAQGERALTLLRSPAALASFPRYATAVRQLQTLLSVYGLPGERLTLGDYEHPQLSPFAPADLHALADGTVHTLFYRYFCDELLPRIAALAPRMVAVSINYRHQVLPAFELAGLLRRALPGVRLVAGGGMITSWQRPLQETGLRLPVFDHLVFGPGEEPLLRLAQGDVQHDLLSGAQIAFEPDFCDLPPAAYLSPYPILPLATSRGCYWSRCHFCPEAAAPTHPYAAFPGADLPARLRTLGHTYGVRHFHFTDNAIPVTTLRVLATAGDLLTGLRWHGFVRFERALLDPELIAGLARSGCALLQLGLESGSQRVLDRMAKGTRLEEVSAILHHLHRAGIASYVYVMVGMPGETAEDVELTRRFLLAHAGLIGYLNLALMNLPRDAGLLAAADDFGIVETGLHDAAAPLGLYRGFVAAESLDRGAARRLLQSLRSEAALRPILQRTPPWFSSNHAFFFPPGAGMC